MENCKADNIAEKLLEVTRNRISYHYAGNIYIEVFI